MQLLSAEGDLVVEQGHLYRVRNQVIGQDFYDNLTLARDHRIPGSDYMQVASIPQALVDHWIAQGFDFWKANAREICDRLRKEGYDYMITGS